MDTYFTVLFYGTQICCTLLVNYRYTVPFEIFVPAVNYRHLIHIIGA